MMMNLFSSFDPATNFSTSLNWISTLILFILIPLNFWLIPNRLNFINFKIMNIMHKEFKILTKMNSSSLIFITLLYFIFMNNFLGLFPYIFTSSSHMIFTFSLAFPLWLTFMVYGWLNNTYHMMAHLVPSGTPGILMPFMVCIESISNLIRPGTLAIRLMANMMAGHLLLTLLGNTGPYLNFMLSILIVTQILLIVLETAVSMIQSYVFAVLATLYSSEVNYVK
uniref:ATP synthase subunit a n=1 Tax=Cucujoidea sp. 42 KM-2017 TaxID=2219381 RepID=A0A346RJ07_9CUCU|nr:ATP synthase F0 subunit 6 [Cucujoidea sp. 42 KM-2017]